MKKTIAVLLAVLIPFSFAGCNKNSAYLDYDLDEYIQLAPYDIFELDKNSVQFKLDTEYMHYTNVSDLGVEIESEEITKGTVKSLDTVNIDYSGKKDGVAFDGGTAEDQEIMIGSSTFIQGFESGLIGKNIGSTVDLNLTFPEDYQEEKLAGQDVVFTVKINSISRPVMPTLDDELLSKLGYDSLDEYNKNLENTVIGNSVWNAAVRNAKVLKYPEKELNDYIEDNLDAVKDEAEQAGTTLENYLSSNGLTEENYTNYVKNYAQSYIMQKMIFYSISRKENIAVSDDEVNEVIEKSYKDKEVTDEDKEFIKENLLQKKVCDFLISKSKIR